MFFRSLLLSCAVLLLCCAPALAADEAGFISYPSISADGETVYFTYWGDIWAAPRDGSGHARRLTDNVAYDGRPTVSPDGKQIAFLSDRFGDYDVYVMPAAGGEAKRLTWHSGIDYIYDWAPDGQSVLTYSEREQDVWALTLLEVHLDGTEPTRVAHPGHDDMVFGSYLGSRDRIVYTRGPGNWARKRYEGQSTYNIWTYDRSSGMHRSLVSDDRQNFWPQAAPDGSTVYFVSEREGVRNLWKIASSGGSAQQVTFFDEDGPGWPRISGDGDEIVYDRLGELWVTDLASGESEQVRVTFADDPKSEMEIDSTVANMADEYAFSPNGSYFAAVIMGDLYILKNPDKYKDDEKPDQDLSRAHRIVNTDSREMHVSWHPDSNKVIYISDRNGQYDVYTYDLATREEERLTSTSQEEWYPAYSPKGGHIAWYSGNRSLMLHDTESGETSTLAEGTLKLGPWQLGYEWSPDGKWIAYTVATLAWRADVMLVNIDDKMPVNISHTPDFDTEPAWSQDGKYLAWTHESENGWEVMLLELDPEKATYDTELLFPDDMPEEPKQEEDADEEADSEGEGGDEAAAEGGSEEGGDEEAEEEEEDLISIDLDEIHLRSESISRMAGDAGGPQFDPNSSFLLFTTDHEGLSAVYTMTLEERDYTRLGDDNGSGYQFAPDGSKLFYLANGMIQYFQMGGASATGGGAVPLSGTLSASQHAVWKQMLADGWRQLRDGFYDENMHGVDWEMQYERYARLVEECGDPDEFGLLYRQMLGELGASHLGYFSGDNTQEAPSDNTADFGVVFDPDHTGVGWRVMQVTTNGPADTAGSELYPGDIVLAVNGTSVDATTNRGRVLRNLSGMPVTLTVESGEEYIAMRRTETEEIGEMGYEREVVIMPATYGALGTLRYEDWVRGNREMVYELGGKRIAYQHIRGNSWPYLEQFRRELFSESYDKDALIIDVRFNGGGNIHEDLVELLDRRPFAVHAHRGSEQGTNPILRWGKPIVVLINAHSYSDAEIFPIIMKELGLGTIIGENTGGNVIGTYNFPLMDGTLRMPAWGWYRLDGLNMEMNGAVPDIFVHIDPNLLDEGRDNQIEAAVDFLLDEIQ